MISLMTAKTKTPLAFPLLAIGCSVVLIAIALPWFGSARQPRPDRIVLETFDDKGAGFKRNWKTRRGSPETVNKVYQVTSERGRRFLRASTRSDHSLSIQAGKLVNSHGAHTAQVSWKLRDYPVLSWEWRVHQLPRGGNELVDDKNDSAAGVYVVFFKRKLPLLSWKYQPYNIIKYVWSAEMPLHRYATREFALLGFIPIIKTVYRPIRSGKRDLGKWVAEKRNVLKDYQKYFNEPPKYDPILIAILTDSNDTKSTSIADYDNFIALKE